MGTKSEPEFVRWLRCAVKILVLTSRPIWPPTDGGQILSYNTVKGLAQRGHALTLASVGAGEPTVPELQQYCEWVPGKRRLRNSVPAILANVLSPLPYTIAKYRARWLRTRLCDLCSRERFDIVQAEGLHMASYAAELGDKFELASVLRAQNIESDIMEGFHRRSSQAHIKAYAYLQLKKIRRYEPMICERVDQCIMISDDDERRIRCMNPRVHASTVPAGVDESFFKPMPDVEERGSLVFVGSFGWAPNLDGIEWFLQDVFPSIRQAVPEARLYVVGKEPPQRLTQIRTPGVVVTGFVQDVRTFMGRGSVFVAPLRMGSGVRIKILNAMAMARPIVTTTLGAQGLDVAEGEHLLIADSPELFADRVVELLLNAEYRRRLGNAARELVGARYTWEHATALLEKEYQTLLAR